MNLQRCRNTNEAEYVAGKIQDILQGAARGMKLIPMNEKRPAIEDWPNKATTDEKQLIEWFGNGSGYNVGMATGRTSMLIVFDVDENHGGLESLSGLEQEHGKLPDTWTVETGRGWHYYFRYPDGFDGMLGNKTVLDGMPGIDFRGDGGCVVQPPSVHQNGKTYEWVKGKNPDDIEVAEAPEWLIRLVTKQAPKPKPTATSGDKIAEGQRNDHLAKVAGSMRRFGSSEEVILKALTEINRDQCVPPLDDDEVAGIAASIAQYEPAEDVEDSQLAADLANKKAAAQMVTIGEKTELFHDDRKDAYTVIENGGIRMIRSLVKAEFKMWLSNQLYERTEVPPGTDAINSAINILSAKAIYGGPCHMLNLRFAEKDDEFWVDLADDKHRAIRINEMEWKIEDKPPVLFKRFSHMKALPDPSAQGDIKRIFDFVNVASPEDKLLLMIWMTSCLVPDIPKPILILHGTQGAGKSFASKILKGLIDPSVAPLSTLYASDEAQLMQHLDHHALPVFDNQSSISRNVADTLCETVTGASFSKRRLYTNDDDHIFICKRPIIINGISIPTEAPDFMDRSITVELERLTSKQRKSERELGRLFDELKPVIFGGMLDTLVAALNEPHEEHRESPIRMADFFDWGCRITAALGHMEEEFTAALSDNSDQRTSDMLGSNLFVRAIEEFIDKANGCEWEGNATDLFKRLTNNRTEKPTKYDQWPRNPSYLSKRLRELVPQLGEIGIVATFTKNKKEGRQVRLKKVAEEPSLAYSVSP